MRWFVRLTKLMHSPLFINPIGVKIFFVTGMNGTGGHKKIVTESGTSLAINTTFIFQKKSISVLIL